MKPVSIRQRRFLDIRECVIGEQGVSLIVNEPAKYSRYGIPFEDIPEESRVITVSYRILPLIAIPLAALFLIYIPGLFNFDVSHDWANTAIFLVPAIIMLIIFLYTWRTYEIFSCGDLNLVLFHQSPSKAVYEEFMDTLRHRRREYLKERYGHIDKDMPITDELLKLAALRDREVITDDEFKQIKSDLINRLFQGKIGFISGEN